jgi:tripartite-type tricarboxylate transporter receptor subunit TctC
LRILNKLFAASVGFFTLFACHASYAQGQFPSKPIKIVVPYSAGGITDTLSRLVAEDISVPLGQPVIVENKPGASGRLATNFVAKSAPDGYTVLLGALAPLVISNLIDDLPYDPLKDFSPITQIASTPMLLVVHPTVPADNLHDLIALLKKEPDRFNYSSSGVGTPSHLCTEFLKRQTGVSITHVPYKGTSASVPDLLAGTIQITCDSPVVLAPFVESNKLKGLAITSDERLPSLQKVPTFKEQGMPEMNVDGWYGFLTPAGTDPKVVEALHNAISTSINGKKVGDRIRELGVMPKTGSPAGLGELIEQEHAKWRDLVESLDLRADS